LIQKLEQNVFRPEYVLLQEFVVNDSFFSYEACMVKFNSLNMYEVEKTFFLEYAGKGNEPFGRFKRESFLFKLKPGYKPM
jgi:hypothetical protein